MGNTIPRSEPHSEWPESSVDYIPQHPDATKITKEPGEPITGKVLEVLTDIRTAMERFAFDTDTQAAEAYRAAQTLRETFLNAVAAAQGLPAQHRRILFNIFSVLVLLIDALHSLVAVHQELQEIPREKTGLVKQTLIPMFKNRAEEYRQWLLKTIVTKET